MPHLPRAGVTAVRLLTTAFNCLRPSAAADRATARALLANRVEWSADAPPSDYRPEGYVAKDDNCYGWATGAFESYSPGLFAIRFRQDQQATALQRDGGTIRDRHTVGWLVAADRLLPLTTSGPHSSWPLGWPVAVYLADGVDFHVARIDADGGFSDKPGRNAALRWRVWGAADLLARVHLDDDGKVRVYRLVGFYWAAPSLLQATR